MEHKEITGEFKRTKQIEDLSSKIIESNAAIVSAIVAARSALYRIERLMEIDVEIKDALNGKYLDIHCYAVLLKDFLEQLLGCESIEIKAE
ncbi:hypothetical protein pCXcHC2016_07 [Xenohaliotis phage pCXc-HC2016]|nr:hypothetical protein pCXcHC2016_07 [Xenohaliotis phage pCXc-HC2016]AQW89114.1 hypothetical protein pCXcHR2015_07 [Xenohaliotis phage pCXc-HR2015]